MKIPAAWKSRRPFGLSIQQFPPEPADEPGRNVFPADGVLLLPKRLRLSPVAAVSPAELFLNLSSSFRLLDRFGKASFQLNRRKINLYFLLLLLLTVFDANHHPWHENYFDLKYLIFLYLTF